VILHSRKQLTNRWNEQKRKFLRVDTLSDEDEADCALDSLEAERKFLDAIKSHMEGKANYLKKLWQQYKEEGNVKRTQMTVDRILKVTRKSLDEFLRQCFTKYERSVVQPGHAVGAIAAQSIGEPGTQMTLKTFHFAGLGGMHTTEGVPRIKEIINAAKYISTPVITCELENKTSEWAAHIVKGRIEKTYLRDIAAYIEDAWSSSEGCIRLRIDFERIAKLQLDITMTDIMYAIIRTKGLKIKEQHIRCHGNHVRICPEPPAEIEEIEGAAAELDENGLPVSKLKGGRGTLARGRSSKQAPSHFVLIQEIMRDLLNVVVKGYPETSRAIIKRSDSPNADGIEELQLLVEGYGLSSCMATPGINPYKTKTNSVIETFQTLGIEAARSTIFNEMQNVMRSMDIAPHHIQLLADTMTVRGEVLGITRFGMAKSKDSVLQLASFERTPDHLFEAGTRMKEDKIQGVSESIIVGQPVGVGTGMARVYRPLGLDDKDFKRKEPLFATAWEENRVGTGWKRSYGSVLT